MRSSYPQNVVIAPQENQAAATFARAPFRLPSCVHAGKVDIGLVTRTFHSAFSLTDFWLLVAAVALIVVLIG
jgi:hypothetical protein